MAEAIVSQVGVYEDYKSQESGNVVMRVQKGTNDGDIQWVATPPTSTPVVVMTLDSTTSSMRVNSVSSQLLPATGTTNLTQADSGKRFGLVEATGSTTINLPAPFTGASFEFYVVGTWSPANTLTTTDGTHTQVIQSTANTTGSMTNVTNIYGSMLSVPGTPAFTLESAKQTITLSATAANVKVGDYVKLKSIDGLTYTMECYSQGAAAGWSFA